MFTDLELEVKKTEIRSIFNVRVIDQQLYYQLNDKTLLNFQTVLFHQIRSLNSIELGEVSKYFRTTKFKKYFEFINK